jgi:hypothetical protein
MKLLGYPAQIQFRYSNKTRTVFVMPCDETVLDCYKIPRYFWNDDTRELEVTRTTLVNAIVQRTDWNPGSAYRVEGVFDEENILAIFRLDEAVKIE